MVVGLASSSSQNEAISTALIADLEHRNAQSLVEGSPQLTGLGVPESTSTPTRLALVLEDDARLRVQRDHYLELGESFTAFETDVALNSVQITGDSATVTFTESTTLQRSPYETGEAAPEYAYSFPPGGDASAARGHLVSRHPHPRDGAHPGRSPGNRRTGRLPRQLTVRPLGSDRSDRSPPTLSGSHRHRAREGVLRRIATTRRTKVARAT
ncbi:hypothetical protein [Rathayibacter sp. AY1B5]|uniref:hypothetical protein n=1 Tax=Rathayibacter sp. AY1B5 TaxID=2080530 RepID=UPI000CE7E98D|nr:hypothetical protein [Rathayibacter sp. AY1B5]PPI23876.1 hypothetical protein C5D44_12850 [Rathayibacter sp. AY1B5]